MKRGSRGHRTIGELEKYSLGTLPPAQIDDLEQHLLICERCRQRLIEIEPYNFVHYTKDGLLYWRITRMASGAFFARHWTQDLEGGKEYRTQAAAKSYLTRTFRQMFPEHRCTSSCGLTGPPANRVD